MFTEAINLYWLSKLIRDFIYRQKSHAGLLIANYWTVNLNSNLTKFFTCYDCYPCEIPPLPPVLFPRKHGRTRLNALLNFRYVRVYINGLHPLFSMARVVVIIKKLSGNGQKPPVNVKQNAPTKWGSQQRTKVPFTIRSIRTTFISFLKGEKKNRKRRKQSRRKPIFCVLTSVESTVDFVGASFLPAGQRERGLLNCGDGWVKLK